MFSRPTELDLEGAEANGNGKYNPIGNQRQKQYITFVLDSFSLGSLTSPGDS